MIELADLKIYSQYIELICYTNIIIKKYPKSERYALANDVKNTTHAGMEYIIQAHKVYDKSEKLKILENLDVKLKFLKVLIRVSYKNKYISSNNYTAWCRKLTNITNLLGGWINSCLKR